MFKTRSYQKELMDDLDLASDALKQNLRELELINTVLGGYKVTLSALKDLKLEKGDSLSIIDIGSGAGDMLREMTKWARKKNLNCRLTGLDANQFMIDYAISKCKTFPEIDFKKVNIFQVKPEDLNADVITMNLFCHHFTDEELKSIFTLISKSSVKTLIINDLHRHPLAYYSIYFLTRLFNGSYLVQNDAPLSVKRAFLKNELEQLFVNTSYPRIRIKWFWAFRWQLCAFKDD
jgi:ubiquinone/menaquinone biosynthesis C-methylase UbiE